MHVHVLEEKFFIAQFRGPPLTGMHRYKQTVESGCMVEFPAPPKINMLSSSLDCYVSCWDDGLPRWCMIEDIRLDLTLRTTR